MPPTDAASSARVVPATAKPLKSVTVSAYSRQPPPIRSAAVPLERRRERRRNLMPTTASRGESSTSRASRLQPATRSTAKRSANSGSTGAGGSSTVVSGGGTSRGSSVSTTGGGSTDCGRDTTVGSSGCFAGTSRTAGFGSIATHPSAAVCTSTQAVTSAPVTATACPGSAALFGAKPSTTRAGKPRPRARMAAATAYCSASPSIGTSVNSSVMRSAPCPERLTGSLAPTPWLM